MAISSATNDDARTRSAAPRSCQCAARSVSPPRSIPLPGSCGRLRPCGAGTARRARRCRSGSCQTGGRAGDTTQPAFCRPYQQCECHRRTPVRSGDYAGERRSACPCDRAQVLSCKSATPGMERHPPGSRADHRSVVAGRKHCSCVHRPRLAGCARQDHSL